MSKFTFFYLFIFFLIFFKVTNLEVKAVENTQRWFCPRSVQCNQTGANCSSYDNPGHVAKLTTVASDESWRKPLAGKRSYILECVQTNDNLKCTTGYSNLDTQLFNVNNLSALHNSISYNFEGMKVFNADGTVKSTSNNNPLAAGSDSLPTLEWQSSSYGANRKFMGVNFYDAGSDAPCQKGSQSQCLFKFNEVSGVCGSFAWDPYGRVFDSQSLEPINGAVVTLFKRNSNGTFQQFVDSLGIVNNPVQTSETGEFNFVVPDGTYRLEASYTNSRFPFSPNIINDNYTHAYSDLYYSTDTARFKGQDIVQRGSIVHVDIPMDPNGTPFTSNVSLIGYATQINKSAQTNEMIIEGRASHPLTKVSALSQISKTLLTSTNADRLGNFRLTVDQSEITAPDACCQVTLEKVDLTATTSTRNFNNFFSIPLVTAKDITSTSFTVQPIPNSIDGYAYGNDGRLIPQAEVDVLLTFSSTPYFKTQADETGHYQIKSSDLPAMSYKISYKSPLGSTTTLTTSEFIKDNSRYINEKKVNLYFSSNNKNKDNPDFPTPTPTSSLITQRTKISPNITSNPKIPTNPKTTSQNPNSIPFQNQNNPQKTSNESTVDSNNFIVLVGAILLTLVAVVGGILIIFFLKKRNENFQ